MNKNPKLAVKLKDFAEAVSLIAQNFKSIDSDNVLLFHHNDADGLSAGAILLKALERENKKVRSYCLEKPYPAALSSIFNDPFILSDSVFVFADFASGMLPLISEINDKRFLIFILDHHKINHVEDESIRILNPLIYEISGTSDCSASAVCFSFALELNELNKDLSRLALIGAIGDGQIDSEGNLEGVNKDIYTTAKRLGLARKTVEYEILSKEFIPCSRLVACLDALGSVSYLKGGPDLAIKGLLEGFDERYQAIADVALEEYQKALTNFKSSLNIKYSKNVQWFKLDQSFSEMGVKTVGLVCQELRNTLDENKYIAGFQKIPDYIPGLDQFQTKDVKVSMRVPDKLREKIEAGLLPPLTKILPHAATELDGFVDACHPYAAASTVAEGLEEELVKRIDQRLKSWVK